jgi:hypothetical protein
MVQWLRETTALRMVGQPPDDPTVSRRSNGLDKVQRRRVGPKASKRSQRLRRGPTTWKRSHGLEAVQRSRHGPMAWRGPTNSKGSNGPETVQRPRKLQQPQNGPIAWGGESDGLARLMRGIREGPIVSQELGRNGRKVQGPFNVGPIACERSKWP